eukprot:GHVR01059478.1.p1 GENE.GHVR01059478.1~~GHVR01059478.1.p1  ORF type:complete len:162 (+),score=41.25 GHVR01059478.1:37-522(+)
MMSVDSVSNKGYPSVVDRYYKRQYNKEIDQYKFKHMNGLVVVGLSNTHPLVLKYNYNINKNDNNNINTTDINTSVIGTSDIKVEYTDSIRGSSVSGKRKRGAIRVTPTTTIATITTNKHTYTIRSDVHGEVIEWNKSLYTTPHLIATQPEKDGWLLILSTK